MTQQNTEFCFVVLLDTSHVLGIQYEVLSGESQDMEEILPL